MSAKLQQFCSGCIVSRNIVVKRMDSQTHCLTLDPSVVETGILQVNTIAADALAPSVAKTTATILLTM